MNSAVAIDASLLLKLLLPETGADAAASLWQTWLAEERRLVAPWLLPYEAAPSMQPAVLTAVVAAYPCGGVSTVTHENSSEFDMTSYDGMGG